MDVVQVIIIAIGLAVLGGLTSILVQYVKNKKEK